MLAQSMNFIVICHCICLGSTVALYNSKKVLDSHELTGGIKWGNVLFELGFESCFHNTFIWKNNNVYVGFAEFFFYFVVDYRHSETSATALMIASGRGFLSQVEQLISMGASIHCKSSNGW